MKTANTVLGVGTAGAVVLYYRQVPAPYVDPMTALFGFAGLGLLGYYGRAPSIAAIGLGGFIGAGASSVMKRTAGA